MKPDERFTAWYRTEHPRLVTSLTLTTGDPDLAREAADEACARALERWNRVSTMESPAGWTYRVALNVARRRQRRRATERTLLGRAHVAEAVHAEPVDAELWAAVAALPLRQRTAVALRYVADLSERAVAEAMGIAPGTVAATLNAARTRLAAALAAEGASS